MTEPKFTPGPWHVEASRLNPHDEYYVTRKDGGSIADTFTEANANLIAAAPDLYAALDWVDSKLQTFWPADMDDLDEVDITLTYREIRALIDARRKARGE